MRMILLMLLLSGSTGCGGRHAKPYLATVIIPRASLLQDPELLQCDLRLDPPKCKSVKLVYKKGAAQIHLK